MRVKVWLRREGGAWRPPYGQGWTAVGDLHLVHGKVDDRHIPQLELLGASREWPALYEPRLRSLSAGEISFLGWERHGRAWVLQQWDCELVQ